MQLVSDGGSHGRSKSRRAKAAAEAAAAKGGGRVRTWYDAPPILSTGKFLRSTTTWFRLRECFQDLERGDAAGMLRNSRLEHTALRAEGVDHEVVNLARLLQQRVRAQRRRVPLPAPTPTGQHNTRAQHNEQSQHKGSEAAQGCRHKGSRSVAVGARTSSSSSSKPFPTICRPPTFICTFGQVASSVMHALHSAFFVASALKDSGPAKPPQWSQMIVREGQAVARSFRPRRT